MKTTSQLFYQEIAKCEPRPNAEIVDLIRKYQHGNLSASAKQRIKDIVINANMRLVVSIARSYKCKSLSNMDIIMEGAIGLNEAVDRFDTERGVAFSTFATTYIKKYIRIAIRNAELMIRIPESIFNKLKDITNYLGEHPTASTEEVAEAVELPVERVCELLPYMNCQVSLDREVANKDGDTDSLSDLIASDELETPMEVFARTSIKKDLAVILEGLDQKEQTVLVKHYGLDGSDPLSLRAIGEILGCSGETVRQVEKRVFLRLRADNKVQALYDMVRVNVNRA